MYEVHVGTRSGTVGKLRARTLGMHGLEPLACMDVMDGLCEAKQIHHNGLALQSKLSPLQMIGFAEQSQSIIKKALQSKANLS